MPEIIAVFQKLSQKDAQIRILTQMFIIQFVLLLLFALVSFGLTWAVVINNSNPVNKGVMTDRTSGEPIQVASVDLALREGMLVSRNGSTLSSSAVQVSLHETINSQLNSNWATADLLQVKSIILSDQNSKGSFFSADVTGMARTLNSSGVGFVLFQTSLGRFILQEDSLLPAEEFQGGVLVNASAMDIVSLGARSERRSWWSFLSPKAKVAATVAQVACKLVRTVARRTCWEVQTEGSSRSNQFCGSSASIFIQNMPCSPTDLVKEAIREIYRSVERGGIWAGTAQSPGLWGGTPQSPGLWGK
jgi:hypothetical protein